jgi:hypothetical protein
MVFTGDGRLQITQLGQGFLRNISHIFDRFLQGDKSYKMTGP